jgi:hypothetical protein
MIGIPPPPAVPKSDHADDRPCHPEVPGQINESADVEWAPPGYAAGKLDTNVKKLETEDR